MDDIIFGATNECLCKEFFTIMQNEFEMSMMGELNFFLGLQVVQTQDGTFINQANYTKELLKDLEWSIQSKLERLCVHPSNLTKMKKV